MHGSSFRTPFKGFYTSYLKYDLFLLITFTMISLKSLGINFHGVSKKSGFWKLINLYRLPSRFQSDELSTFCESAKQFNKIHENWCSTDSDETKVYICIIPPFYIFFSSVKLIKI